MNKLAGSPLRAFVAAVLASIIWVFVSFTENPQQVTPFTNLPIRAEGLNSSLTLVDGEGRPIPVPDAVVNLNVSGPQDTITRITKQNVQPFINVAGLEPGSHEVAVQARSIPSRSDLDFQSFQPATVLVQIEQIITASLPLTITTEGQPPTSYEASLPIASVNGEMIKQVTITGPASQVNKVVGGEITLDLSSQTSNLRTRRNITAVDIAGRDVEGVTVSPELADIEVRILSSSGIKRVPIIYTTLNGPPAGYRADVVLEPAFVTLIGSAQRLTEVEFVETQPLNLPNATQSYTATIKLRFPIGVTPRDAQAADSTIATVRFVPINTEIVLTLPLVPRNLAGGLELSYQPRQVEVTLRGNAQNLQNLTDLALVLDLAGRTAGSYSIQPSLNLPSGVTLAKPLSVIQVTISTISIPTNELASPTNPINPTEPSAPEATPVSTPTVTEPISPTEPVSPTEPISPTLTP
ncbi:CdaR family protein [Herpetosiphon sp. NSE202]|uniref:CdaR family protein n=1 Tax=Herpetosiphon sp. NSE202 TaxID=3351349 RepID=UPI0036388BFA